MPHTLWLAPHRLAADAVRRQLAAVGIDAAMAPGVRTMARYAESVVSLDVASPTILPSPATEWLLEQSIDRLHQAGKLVAMAEVAERAGLVEAVEQMIAQLKSRGVTAAQFSAWSKSKQRARRDRELAEVYVAYQDALEHARAADRFDITRLAVESMERTPGDPWDLVVIDGFRSFDASERTLVERLVNRSCEVWFSLASIDRHDRHDLTATARRTQMWIESRWPDATCHPLTETGHGRPPALEHMSQSLFLPPTDDAQLAPEVGRDVDRIRVVPATDAFDEATQVARRIKSLLVAGVPANDIGVAVPSIEPHRLRLKEVFVSYGIPFSFGAPSTIGDDPALRALEAVLALEADDWSFRRLVATFGCGLYAALEQTAVQPPWRTARGAAEWLVRELQVAGGRKTLLDYIDRLSDLAIEAGEPTNPTQAAAMVARPVFAKLAAATESLPRSASPTEWTATCAELARALELRLPSRTAEAWLQVREAAAWIERTAAMLGRSTVSWTLAEWLGHLSRWMNSVPASLPTDEQGRVCVYGAAMARFARPRHLFMVGLEEQSYSTAAATNGLYSEKQYDSLVAGDTEGRPLPVTLPHERAMQLFYDVVRSVRDSVTFSFAALDASGQPEPPSPMLVEACAALGDDFARQLDQTPVVTSLPPVDCTPRSLRDWRLLAVHRASEGRPELLGGLLKSQAACPANDALAGALVAMHHRLRGGSFGPMEGILAGPDARRWFAERYNVDHQWSTSQLETYATCPFKFLMQNVLTVQPLGEVALETDHRRRGSLLHRALGELHARLAQWASDRRQPSEYDADAFADALEMAVEMAREQLAGFGIDAVLNDLLAADVRKWSSTYYDQHTKYDKQSRSFDEPLAPEYFELRFGKPSRHADDDEAPESTDEPFVLDLGDGMSIRIGGRIDRVDTGRVGNAKVLQVIDYKSASAFTMTQEELYDGRKLQPAVYSLAAAEILSTADQRAVPLKSGYWLVRRSGFGDSTTQALFTVEAGEVRPSEEWKELEPAVRARIRQIVEGVRHGDFPMHSPIDDCTRNCDYSHVCRVAQVRSLNKVWPPPNDQQPIESQASDVRDD